MTEPLLRVENLKVGIEDRSGRWLPVLQGVDLVIESGQAVALTGPSGCGKSLFARAICGLLPPVVQSSGGIFWRGKEMTGNWSEKRGGAMTLILQEPATSLNPVLTVGHQIAEAWALHHPEKRSQAKEQSLRLMQEVRLVSPSETSGRYPHQLSGGMRQRVLLAAALACDPDLLIADEPTTSLDPTVQKDILALIREIRLRREMALLFISHDPHLVSLVTDRSYQVQAGKLIEGVFAGDLQVESLHPDDRPESPRPSKPVLQADDLVVEYGNHGWGGLGRGQGGVCAVDGVSLELYPGRAMGLVGESGCGKTTLARALVLQTPLRSGCILVEGKDTRQHLGRALREARRAGQLVHQDPAASLNPRQRVGDMLGEALGERVASIPGLLQEVGLGSELVRRFPHELSGGQKQRVALARALAVDPKFLIADEITSALDPVATDRIMSLLADIMKQRELAVLHISHDLDLLHRWCHKIVVMSRGHILEQYSGLGVGKARHPYTLELLASRPHALRGDQLTLHQENKSLPRDRKSLGPGCPWAPFCNEVISSCYKVLPPLVAVGEGHFSRCPVVEANGPSTFIDTL